MTSSQAARQIFTILWTAADYHEREKGLHGDDDGDGLETTLNS